MVSEEVKQSLGFRGGVVGEVYWQVGHLGAEQLECGELGDSEVGQLISDHIDLGKRDVGVNGSKFLGEIKVARLELLTMGFAVGESIPLLGVHRGKLE